MIISSLVEENGGDKRPGEGGGAAAVGDEVGGAGMSDDDRHEYQTANQLFELMVQDHDFNSTEDDSLSQRDLVLIYKNLDLGTQLMSNANEFKRNRPNQYVETVVYKDEGDSDSSELSDTQYSSEDLYNMVLINKERIDLLNCGSAGNTLCNKLGNIRLTTSKLNSEYNSHNIYNNTYLKNLNLLSNSDDHSMLPDSLLDYICCKRLEDNYNFYMDSIIIYVKHTIEQLRRISDGDYLTDRVKERWREVDSKEKHDNKENGDTKILATCTSIPLPIERKMNGSYTKWDEIVHSEVDRRSLSKILEKKIIIEVPKVICDSYKLFSKCCADNLVISCKKQKKTELPEKIEKDSRVDVVFQLKPSESGQVISNINSVMILHSAPTFKEEASCAEPLRIAYKNEVDKVIALQDNFKYDENYDEERVTEITENNVKATKKVFEQELTPQVPVASEFVEALNITHVGSHGDTNVCPYEKVNAPQLEPTIRLGNVKENVKIPTADLLSMTIQRLNQNALTCMPEESEDEIIYNVPYKKKLLPKRVKSPYENKTYIIEEKKRKHLLEIRQKREKKKKAMGENSTLNINKYGADSMAPKASNSITQISISNKSFYNSIFGKTSRDTFKQAKSKSKRKYQKSDLGINKNNIGVDSLERDSLSWNTESSDKKKCINYDLDDIETEMMQATNVRNESTSSPDCSVKFNYSESIEVSVTCSDQGSSNQQFSNSQSVVAGPSVKNEKKDSNENDGFDKFTTASECRKNISKIYDLVQKLGKSDVETKPTKSKFTAFNDKKCNNVPDQDNKTVQLSDNAGSIKNHLPSSDSSLPNLEINSNKETNPMQTKKKQRINSPRSQIPRYHAPKSKEVKSFKPQTQYDNPLKAISDLIHNLDNMKKPNTEKIAKFRTAPEVKSGRKPEINDKDQKNRKINFHVDSPDTQTVKKQRLLRLDNHVLKPKLSDIIDEQKEARGEAVKGPSTTSRIDALAQPRKSYVQAHREEIMAKSGRRWSPQKPALGTHMAGKISAKTSVGVSSRQQRNYLEPMSRRRLVSPTLPAQLERQRSLSPQYPARAPATVSPPRATIGHARVPARLSPPRSSPMTSWVAATDHRQQNSRRHAKVVTDPIIIKKETRTVKHVSYGDPVITQVRTRSPSPPKYLEREFRALKPIEINPNLGETVQAIINNMPSTATGTVTDLTCTSDSYSHFSKDNCISEPVSFNCTYSVTSNHEVDIFEDKSIVTEVQGIQDIEDSETSKPEKENLDKTSTEMRKLEFVLNRQKLQGNLQKRLRIKNLTLRPDRSMRKMFVLQSGDAGSMLLDSTSDNYLINDASKQHFEWSLSNIPMQVNTIGYSFAKFKSVQCGQSEIKLNALCKCNERKSELLVVGPNKTCQCSSTSDLKWSLANTETGNNAERIEEKAAKANDSQQIKAKTKILTELTNVEQQRSLVRTIDKHLKSDTEVKSNQSADESNSLDVLVGLLNEIQKITTCQTNITNTLPGNFDYQTAENNNNLEAIIKEAAIAKLVGCGREAKNAGDNPLQMLSITSLEKLRQLESDPSLYSLYISNIDDFIERNNSAPVSLKSEDMQILPPYKDVEVSVNIPKKQYISRVTDVPSTLLTLSLNKSTDVSDSLCRLLKESSTSKPANLCSTQHQPIYVNSNYQCCRCTIDLAIKSTEQTLEQHVARSPKIKEFAEGPKVTEPLKSDKNICITKNNKDPSSSELSRKISDYCNEASELDHVMKIKRDILVTVYSILVFTVFAALSFPAELI